MYCSVTLKWNYNEGYVDIVMPEYIKRLLEKYNYKKKRKSQYLPYPVQPQKFRKVAQDPMPEDNTLKRVDNKQRKRV